MGGYPGGIRGFNFFISIGRFSPAAMATIEVPFTDQEVDTSEPTSALTAILFLIAGFAVFAMTRSIGENAGQTLNQALGSILGVNPATGESDDGIPGV